MSISREEIYTKVRKTLIEALGVDDDEITEDARLMEDLGAESIDFLDIVFRLEKSFDIKIPREELFPGDEVLSNTEYVVDGKVTSAGLAALKAQLPHMDISEFEADPNVNKVGNLLRVKGILDYVQGKVGEN